MQALGIGSGTGYRTISWIKNKQFPVKYKTRLNFKIKIVYLVDFWKWALKNRTLIDWSKVEKNILGPEPDWVHDQRKVNHLTNLKIKTTSWTTTEDNRFLLNHESSGGLAFLLIGYARRGRFFVVTIDKYYPYWIARKGLKIGEAEQIGKEVVTGRVCLDYLKAFDG